MQKMIKTRESFCLEATYVLARLKAFRICGLCLCNPGDPQVNWRGRRTPFYVLFSVSTHTALQACEREWLNSVVELEQSIIGTLLYKGLQRVKWLKIPLLHCILEHTPLVGGLCKRPLLSFVHNCSVS